MTSFIKTKYWEWEENAWFADDLLFKGSMSIHRPTSYFAHWTLSWILPSLFLLSFLHVLPKPSFTSLLLMEYYLSTDSFLSSNNRNVRNELVRETDSQHGRAIKDVKQVLHIYFISSGGGFYDLEKSVFQKKIFLQV